MRVNSNLGMTYPRSVLHWFSGIIYLPQTILNLWNLDVDYAKWFTYIFLSKIIISINPQIRDIYVCAQVSNSSPAGCETQKRKKTVVRSWAYGGAVVVRQPYCDTELCHCYSSDSIRFSNNMVRCAAYGCKNGHWNTKGKTGITFHR